MKSDRPNPRRVVEILLTRASEKGLALTIKDLVDQAHDERIRSREIVMAVDYDGKNEAANLFARTNLSTVDALTACNDLILCGDVIRRRDESKAWAYEARSYASFLCLVRGPGGFDHGARVRVKPSVKTRHKGLPARDTRERIFSREVGTLRIESGPGWWRTVVVFDRGRVFVPSSEQDWKPFALVKDGAK
jgi:hypothetical protein